MKRAVLILGMCFGLAACGGGGTRVPESAASGVDSALAEATGATPVAAPAPQVAARPARRGLFSRLVGSNKGADSPEVDITTPVAPEPERRGLMASLRGEPRPPQPVAAPLPSLAFGMIQKDCAVTSKAMGRKVAENIGYAIHDSRPGINGQRTFYITGFRDRCARKVRGAMVLFGDSQGHEFLRYRSKREYSNLDQVYERIKGRVCGVPSGKYCTSNRSSLDAQLTFLSVYKTFGASALRHTYLLHSGKVVAEN